MTLSHEPSNRDWESKECCGSFPWGQRHVFTNNPALASHHTTPHHTPHSTPHCKSILTFDLIQHIQLLYEMFVKLQILLETFGYWHWDACWLKWWPAFCLYPRWCIEVWQLWPYFWQGKAFKLKSVCKWQSLRRQHYSSWLFVQLITPPWELGSREDS